MKKSTFFAFRLVAGCLTTQFATVSLPPKYFSLAVYSPGVVRVSCGQGCQDLDKEEVVK